jgi:hypothetical protein
MNLRSNEVIELIKRYSKGAAGGGSGGTIHDRLHSITSVLDHSSAATPGRVLIADNNGLPIEGIVPDTDLAIVRDPIPEVDTLLVKNSNVSLKEYSPIIVGFGLEIVINDEGNQVLQITDSPQAPIGRRLISPLGAPFTQGVI